MKLFMINISVKCIWCTILYAEYNITNIYSQFKIKSFSINVKLYMGEAQVA